MVIYMPSDGEKSFPFYCEDCVSRGCSCNEWNIKECDPEGIEDKDWKWINKIEGDYEQLDDNGQSLPCCEFAYEKEGFDEEEFKI